MAGRALLKAATGSSKIFSHAKHALSKLRKKAELANFFITPSYNTLEESKVITDLFLSVSTIVFVRLIC